MNITPAAPSLIDSRSAAWRLLTTLGLVVLGNSSMYVVSVVLPQVQAEFGISRADASLPYTLMMVCLGLGGLWTGRMADRHGLTPVLLLGAAAVCAGFVGAGMASSIWLFGLAHGLMGLIGSAATFAPLMADTALWWNRRRGIAVAICCSSRVWPAVWPCRCRRSTSWPTAPTWALGRHEAPKCSRSCSPAASSAAWSRG